MGVLQIFAGRIGLYAGNKGEQWVEYWANVKRG
jgi:hypothetical protein